MEAGSGAGVGAGPGGVGGGGGAGGPGGGASQAHSVDGQSGGSWLQLVLHQPSLTEGDMEWHALAGWSGTREALSAAGVAHAKAKDVKANMF